MHWFWLFIVYLQYYDKLEVKFNGIDSNAQPFKSILHVIAILGEIFRL